MRKGIDHPNIYGFTTLSWLDLNDTSGPILENNQNGIRIEPGLKDLLSARPRRVEKIDSGDFASNFLP